mgnify:CR=1 FL=1
MTREEYMEFIKHQPCGAMGDFSFLLNEKLIKLKILRQRKKMKI